MTTLKLTPAEIRTILRVNAPDDISHETRAILRDAINYAQIAYSQDRDAETCYLADDVVDYVSNNFETTAELRDITYDVAMDAISTIR